MFDRSQQWRARRAGLAGAVAAAALAVAACGSGTQGDTGGAAAARGGGNVTLTLKHITDNEPAFTKLIAEYKKVAPNVTIQAELRAGRRSADLAARAARRRQRARPVRRLARQRLGDVGAAARARPACWPTSPTRRWIKNVPENLQPLLGNDGKTYMCSSGVTPIGAIYNKKVFAEAGVDRAAEDLERAAGDVRQGQGRGQDPASRSATRRRGSRS